MFSSAVCYTVQSQKVYLSRNYLYLYDRFFSGDMLKIKEDAAVVKPTVFVGVPRLYNRIV